MQVKLFFFVFFCTIHMLQASSALQQNYIVPIMIQNGLHFKSSEACWWWLHWEQASFVTSCFSLTVL